ncbi:S-layer homology domain-containing protein [Paenibacillus sp. MBLB2552]|uniref:S-layer homology domain-containing protein n=1 Tax=Paenibacillus mellifer TaxID=2937794 RepID=A0A9X2BRX5_9BACL|nr:S-layer homology domain-containing protein [Paenibacillus mellifer]MCK8487790.1 S-layer homology domain-containing protein [Paenibacillus mellifer]
MFKRNLALLSAAAILSLSLAGESYAAAGAFKDVSHSNAKDSISVLQAKGIVRGVSADSFLPDDQLTTSQGVQLIVNLLGLELKTEVTQGASNYFTNVKEEAWYAPAFVIAQNSGFDLDTSVNPDKPMTREEFTHQLILAMEKHGDLPKINIKPVEFADDDQLTVSYQGTIQRALVLGIAKLDENKQFHPGDQITRAEAAVLTYNAVEYLAAHPAPTQENK